jgi:hypothetical protein
MWEVIVISLALSLGLARVMVGFQVKEIMANWKNYQCQPQVMAFASLFKPDSDPRNGQDFASDNFNFCSSELAKSVLTSALKPVMNVFSSMAAAAIQSIGFTMNLRTLAANLFAGLNGLFDIFVRRFNLTVFEFTKAFKRTMASLEKSSAIATSAVYAGISVIQSIMNAFKLIINIVIAVLIILVVMVIFLFFLLAPTIPMILFVISIVSATAAGSAVAGMGGAFCFPAGTLITMMDGKTKNIEHIILGDLLKDGIVVTAAMAFKPESDVQLYNIDGILVSGTHIIYANGQPLFVKDYPGAIPSTKPSPDLLYCLNTSYHLIPVQGATGIVVFADWEELDNEDMEDWDTFVRTTLGSPVVSVSKEISESETGFYPWLKVLTQQDDGSLVYKSLQSIKIGDYVADVDGWTRVVGIVKISGSEVREFGSLGSSACWIYGPTRSWMRAGEVNKIGSPVSQLLSLFTESGSFIINSVLVRDFSDIGLSNIHTSYDFTLTRLIQKYML